MNNAPPLGNCTTALIEPDVLCQPGPVVIALAGAGCSPEIYRLIHHPVATIHPVDWAAWPAPWTLDSLAARLCATLALRSGPTLLAGVSLGGAIALLTAALASDSVSGLLVSNTGAHTDHHGDPTLPQRVRHGWTQEASDTFLRSCFHHTPDPHLWRAMQAYMSKLNREAFLMAIKSLRSTDLRSHLPNIRCPTLIAHGRHDRRRSIENAKELAAGIQGAELRLLDAGHSPMVDAPDEYLAALDRLLERCGFAAK